ncbi:Gp6 protein [Bacillus cereus AH820]|uniref:Gp6 protein n=1 Tax=Bacillus cereus (strain AH820) TaxID=405535 RepID=B7JPC2_BACC0|nr:MULTISPECIES: head-tail connector protein [Bacillus cereus group]ACK90417.1 Gp6 protein [Bacillus cereus AH820]MEB9454435.1 head-tail connector protein [Bacillus anthracis]
MEQTLNETLLEDVKSRLRITWNDEDKQLIKTIERGKAYLQKLCSTSFSFGEEDQVKQLLIERCRYEYNNALEDFEKNFRGELQRLILESALKERAKGEVIQ